MVRLALSLLPALLCSALPVSTASAAAPETGRITGVGGIFFKARDPAALMAWYRDVLGIAIEDWGGAALATDAPGHPPVVVVNAFPEDSAYMAPSPRPFMLNFAVDDLDAFLARLKARGVEPVGVDTSDPSGKFAWIVDPEGTKIELWQPLPDASAH